MGAMNNVFEILLKKLNIVLNNLNFGKNLLNCDVDEMLNLMHILHYANYSIDDKNLVKILDIYEHKFLF